MDKAYGQADPEIRDYVERTYAPEDPVLAEVRARSTKAGLPDIAVSALDGRLLTVLAAATGAKTCVEVGTLGGYSGLWIASALPYGGRLFTIEADDKHEDFAKREFDKAGVSRSVQIVSGLALNVLPRLSVEMGGNALDMAFIDADKREYPDYARLIKPMLRVGGILVADNALASGEWCLGDDPSTESAKSRPYREGADRMNRMLSDDQDFETTCVPIGHGVLIAVKTR